MNDAIKEYRGSELAQRDELSVDQVISQVQKIQEIMSSVMRDGEHYGVIPGTQNKPSLLKPGAEKLSLTFRLAPRYIVERVDLPNNHREYEVICELYSIITKEFLGSGVGNCNTMEAKYRYRSGPAEPTGIAVPKEYWKIRNTDPVKAQELLGGKGFVTKKNDDGKWEIYERGERIEYDNPADHYNTVKKTAKKRAYVDGILTVTAASDIFTQDVEDLPREILNGSRTEETQKRKKSKKDEDESTSKFWEHVGKKGIKKDDPLMVEHLAEVAKFANMELAEYIAELVAAFDKDEGEVNKLMRTYLARKNKKEKGQEAPKEKGNPSKQEAEKTEPKYSSILVWNNSMQLALDALGPKKYAEVLDAQGIDADKFLQEGQPPAKKIREIEQALAEAIAELPESKPESQEEMFK